MRLLLLLVAASVHAVKERATGFDFPKKNKLGALPAECRDDTDAWRRDQLYKEPCCDAFSLQKKMWMDLHSALSMVAPDAGRPTFNMDMWLDFLERVGLRTSETTIAECVKAFVVACMRWVDDTTFKYNLCDFVLSIIHI